MSEPTETAIDRSPHIVCWNELTTMDAAGSSQFYGSLFGWQTEEMPMEGGACYRFFKSGERVVGGMMEFTPEMGKVPPHWLTYIAVDDIEASTAKALELGAMLCKGVTDVGMGQLSILVDPQGAGFALWQHREDC